MYSKILLCEVKKMLIKNPKIEISATSPKQYPSSELPEIVLVGKSNVGKSSFINTMINRKKLARTSSEPGKTRQINFYNMDDNLFESLLWSSESDSLDFKQQQYIFESGSDDQKSELLKDILAFSNSWRKTEAFILIGVKEAKIGKSEVVGIESHLSSNNLQQFVESKINRPLAFSYFPYEIEGKQVGIIRIPVQTRPFYLNKKYGKLDEGKVYLRRGDSTVIAKPDEISQMGHSQFQKEISTGPELDGTLNFNFSHRPGNKICKLVINILISNNSPFIPSLNTKVKLWIGDHPEDLLKQGHTIHFGEPFSTYKTLEFPIPDMYNPIEHKYRLTFGSDQGALKVSDYAIKITTATEYGLCGMVVRYMEDDCIFKSEVIRENIFLHEVLTLSEF
jgi:hypothetical protein